jgi:hypothetical protein
VRFYETPLHAQGDTHPVNEQTVVSRVGKFNVEFSTQTLSSRAGMVLIKEFIDRLGVAPLLDRELGVKQRRRGYSESEAVLGLVYNMIAGGQCLTDLDVLRGDGGTRELLQVATLLASTTAGEHLRKFDMGDLRDLQRVTRQLQEQVRPHQDATACTIDADSSIYEQASRRKQGCDKAAGVLARAGGVALLAPAAGQRLDVSQRHLVPARGAAARPRAPAEEVPR